MKPAFKWILALSLVANIFLIGFMIGHSAPPPFPPRRDWGKAELEQLSPDKRKQVETMADHMRDRRKDDFRKIKQARKDLIAIMEAPEFDEAAFIAKSKTIDGIFSSSKQQMITEMAEIAKGFNQKERKILAEQLRRPTSPPPAEKPPASAP